MTISNEDLVTLIVRTVLAMARCCESEAEARKVVSAVRDELSP